MEERLTPPKGGAGALGGAQGVALPIGEPSHTTSMGKGLREPCSPYREAYVFGANLNEPSADNWNCVPQVVDATQSFNLSTISPNHEVAVELVALSNIPAGANHSVVIEWYRERDQKRLYRFSYVIPDPGSYGYGYWSWYYVYSYIGYVEWEIWENGNYRVDIFYDGVLVESTAFTVTGILAAYCSVHVEAPSSGQPGEVLEATVTVTNLDPTFAWIFFTEIWAGTELIGSEDDMIEPGTSKIYRGSFTMPDSKITVLGWVERLTPSLEKVYCGSDSADVIPAVVPEYAGTISRKELKYDTTTGSIPVLS